MTDPPWGESRGEVAASKKLPEGLWRNCCGPSTIRFANVSPPHRFAAGRIQKPYTNVNRVWVSTLSMPGGGLVSICAE